MQVPCFIVFFEWGGSEWFWVVLCDSGWFGWFWVVPLFITAGYIYFPTFSNFCLLWWRHKV